MEWINDSNKYEEIWKAYFGYSYELTILHFGDSDYTAFVRKAPSAASIFRTTYESKYTIEEVKKKFVEDFRNFLDERVTFWMTIQHDFWEEVQWLDDVEE